jgi:ABC-type transport system involved in multi-copper enzyme maturation permease subunit
MRISLIAVNFVRENRWPILILSLWIVFTTVATGGFGRERVAVDDVVFYVQQQAVYICGFSAFLAANAIHNERKSRHILLVLSKAISRGEYLLAMLIGTLAMAAVYAGIFAACCTWLAHRAALPVGGVWLVAVLVVAGSAIAAAVGMFFSTFLNPYLAIALTVTMFAAPGLAHPGREPWFRLVPGLPVLLDILHYRFRVGWTMDWGAVVIAAVEATSFWGLAAVVFSYRDIAVPVE